MNDVNSVAEVMGIPAELVRRSADARATANGIPADEILAAWGGGASVAAPPAASSDEPSAEEPSTETEPETQETQDAPPPPTPPPTPAPTPAASTPPTEVREAPVSSEPPVLVGARDNPWAVVAGAVGLFLAVVLLGLVGPAIPADAPGARSGDIQFSAAAEAGHDLYASLGCGACHTQMIRPLVADVGLGPVTLNDTDQVLGTRRFGPDLAEVGARLSGTQMEAIVRGSAGHPGHNLSADDMSELVAYLLESTTTAGTGG